MDDSIKVSVIVAVYNTEKYLRQCLSSIAAQTLHEIEILCINDGSTDGSLAILNEFASSDNRFKIFTKENEGLGAASARNYGLERATGKYISILDSDDWFSPDMLERAYQKAENTEAEIVVFGGVEYDELQGSKKRVASILNCAVIPSKIIFNYKDCFRQIFQLSQGMAWNKLYRRTFLTKTNVKFQKVQFTDDAYFTFAHMVLAEKISVINEDFVYYRVHAGSSQTDKLSNYPDAAFIPYVSLREKLIQAHIYADVEQSFINCAVTFFRYFYDSIREYTALTYLHEKYRKEIFPLFFLEERAPDYFYDRRVYQWVRQILASSAGELSFLALRGYGAVMNTGILRFPLPKDLLPSGEDIYLLADGVKAKYYGAQLVLEDRYRLIHMAEDLDFADMRQLKKATCIFIAYMNEAYTKTIAAELLKRGIAAERIVIG